MESELRQYFDILFRRKWIILSFLSVIIATVAIGTFRQTPIYQAAALLLIEKEQANYSMAREGSIIESSQRDYYQTQYKILKSRSLLRKTIEKLDLAQHPRYQGAEDIVESLNKRIIILPIRNTRLVSVGAESADPALAARIANTLSELFMGQHLESRLFMSQEALAALRGVPGEHSSMAYESLPSVVNNRLIQELKVKHAGLESDLANLQRAYTEKHPAVIQLMRQKTILQARIDLEVRKIAHSVKAELSGQLKGNNVRIIDPAQVPRKPVRPSKGLNLALATFLGLLLGSGLAFLIDRLDLTIKTQDDMERVLKLPFLGALPKIPSGALANKNAAYTLTLETENSFSSETFRNIRTSLAYSSPEGAPRTFLVTSSVAGEGKTVISCNLAIVFAQFGERVLLIDGDLRKPMVNRAFGLSSERGVTSFLVGDAELESLVQDSMVKSLKVLPCGPRPPNPGDILRAPRLRSLLSWGMKNFDRVIVDCTPLHPISDAIIWAKHVHGVVFVAHASKVSAALSVRGITKLRSSNASVVGGVINQAIFEGSGYYNYYYTYGEETDGKKKAKGKSSSRPISA
ncbi:GumC family protein [Elusimicrobiota bacterium]